MVLLNNTPIKIVPNKFCSRCKYFDFTNSDEWYIDNYHFFCQKETTYNEFGDSKPVCIDGYTQGPGDRRVCPYYKNKVRNK